MSKMVTLKVAQGVGEAETELVEYAVPYSAGMSVLDALIWIQTHENPELAFRYSCINANACKECSVMVDGEAAYACTVRLTENGALVEPLIGKDRVRDLVTDILPSKEHLDAALPQPR